MRGRQVALELLDFINGQPAIVVANGSIGSTLQAGYGSYDSLKEFLKSSANFYKGKGLHGSKNAAAKSIKGILKEKKLPTKGKIRYVPPKKFRPTHDLPIKHTSRGEGFVDRLGNVWVEGRSITPGENIEWDVQLSKRGKKMLGWASKSGKHINISLKGKITH